MSASPSSLRILLALESSGPGGAENMVLQLTLALRHGELYASLR